MATTDEGAAGAGELCGIDAAVAGASAAPAAGSLTDEDCETVPLWA
ncbi:hypothetical protein ACKVM7_000249 [Arthrobacter russicus]